MVTRILFDPRRDPPTGAGLVSTAVIVQATPTGIREDGSIVILPTTLSFPIDSADGLLQLVPTTASWKWRLVVRDAATNAVLQQRTVLVPDQASIAYQALVDVDPASLGNTVSAARNWDATFGQILTLIQQATSAGLDDVNNWTANTAYPAGTIVVNPSEQFVQAINTFTSGSTYDPTKWTILTLNLAGVQALIAAQAVADSTTYVQLAQIPIALDTDGTPYFANGSDFTNAVPLRTDTDGVPYLVA